MTMHFNSSAELSATARRRVIRFFAAFCAALPFWCDAAELPSRCGTLPLASEDQAICAATYYLQKKSELCSVTGFSFSVQATGLSWVVQVKPNNWKSSPKCTGDHIEISKQTGQLIEWKQFNYQP